MAEPAPIYTNGAHPPAMRLVPPSSGLYSCVLTLGWSYTRRSVLLTTCQEGRRSSATRWVDFGNKAYLGDSVNGDEKIHKGIDGDPFSGNAF